MSARPGIGSVLLLVAALAVQTSYATTAASVVELRAQRCCGRQCPKERAPTPARECCQVTARTADPALSAPTPSLGHPDAVVVGWSLPAPSTPPVALGTTVGRHAAGPPLFLRVLTLRL